MPLDFPGPMPGDPTPDSQMTENRTHLLSLMPTAMPELEEEFGVAEAQELMQWAGRRNFVKWDRGENAFVLTSAGIRACR